ncbi:tRNA-guanine transglycosylase DpdA [Chamaesiphon polymorphus]|uniref:Queuine/archaeosine tRNA-ribosyltransferase n=1 Tax=Chamaesiphon polymorphus CCALA 037 TaxID=2107692 RepID=A0A2T1GKP3_9CYAN|nr:tRNA-guanine transglycosylase DpdA [Chamaesiphon polymorphus]PSB58392.1 queuine/archaeosine tRNA-ribosyltransferase [Chamaesiphon polymorphus CCALA 037]
MFDPRILVVTSCTGEKRFKPENQLQLDDFKNSELLQSRSAQLAEYLCPAGQMYTGAQHLRLMEGISILRQARGAEAVDLIILSAAYGLIGEEEKIVPYEVTFNTMTSEEIDRWAMTLNVHTDLEEIAQKYDLIFVLLGEQYLRALTLPIISRDEQSTIFLTSTGSLKYLKTSQVKKNVAFILSNIQAKHYGYGLVGLKGFLFKKFAEAVIQNPSILTEVYKRPELFSRVIEDRSIQLNIPIEEDLLDATPVESMKIIDLYQYHQYSSKLGRSETGVGISIPDLKPAANYDLGMEYFIPEWDDRVDPNYDYLGDANTPNRDPYHDDIYAHQIYERPNYNGILLSRVVFDKSKKKSKILLENGVHSYIRYPGKVMGDCGAFSYIQEEKPPYQTKEIIEYYDLVGFDYGVSIDHLIVGGFAKPGIREERYALTMNNAEEFIQEHSKGAYKFTPIGAVQGWSPESYAAAVKSYIGMGYQYIALGGLARAPTPEIIEILQAVYHHLTPTTRIHLFGVGRLNAVPIFRHLGVNSFDSASPLRKAWLDPTANYHTIAGKTYAAVRIPKSGSLRIKNIVKAGIASIETLQQLEEAALSSLRRFDEGKLAIDETLAALTAYDLLLELPRDGKVDSIQATKRMNKHAQMYRVLLEDRPWKQCGCEICSNIGVEVVIFRGNDRNRRRGFHNTYVFNERFNGLLNNADSIAL